MVSKKLYSFLAFLVLVVLMMLWGPMAVSSQDVLKGSATDPPVPTVVFLARSDNPVDALAASSVAGSLGGSVLLTRQDTLSPVTRQALIDLNPDLVVLAGGTGALSKAVEDAVKAIPLATRRVAGANRFETAVALSALAADIGFGRPLLTGATVAGDAGLAGTLSATSLRASSTTTDLAVEGFHSGYSVADQYAYWRPAALFAGRNGVMGITKEPGGYAVVGWDQANSSGSRAGFFNGNVDIIGNGFFSGNVDIFGTLYKSAGSFKIDHPLDPQNKYLYHSFVESPDMMNVYNGNVVLDVNGEAWVEMPEWFEELNKDYRYQLTAIGAPGPNLHIAKKIAGNRFQIAGGTPGMEVSWQVTGIRNDPYAQQNRIPVEQDKNENERGTYMHPQLYGQTESLRIIEQP